MACWGRRRLSGLLHYTIGLCSQHTLLANLTIWAEATAGLALLLVSAVQFSRRLRGTSEPTGARHA